MRQHYLIALSAAFMLLGCQESAESFFSGRPSEMSMIHNRIIAGPPATMIELLKVPARFPDATVMHIANWQGSVVAWWGHPEKRNLMVDSFSKISPNDIRSFKEWVSVRYRYTPKDAYQVLDEIEAFLNTAKYR